MIWNSYNKGLHSRRKKVIQTWIWGSWPGNGAEVGKTWCKNDENPQKNRCYWRKCGFPARSACSFGHGGCIAGTASPTRFGGQENSTDHWRIGRISRLLAILCMMNKISDRVQMLTFIRSVIFSHGWFRMDASTALQSLKEFDDWPSPIILIANRNMDVNTTNRPLLKSKRCFALRFPLAI